MYYISQCSCLLFKCFSLHNFRCLVIPHTFILSKVASSCADYPICFDASHAVSFLHWARIRYLMHSLAYFLWSRSFLSLSHCTRVIDFSVPLSYSLLSSPPLPCIHHLPFRAHLYTPFIYTPFIYPVAGFNSFSYIYESSLGKHHLKSVWKYIPRLQHLYLLGL